jgi:protein gp37
MATKIEWTDRTWNPTTGCNKISAGCKNQFPQAGGNEGEK